MNPYLELFSDIDRWLEQEKAIGVATVIRTWGSSPRQPGAKMVFSSAGDISGSVSGGCVEGAVVQTGLQVIETQRPELLHFGVTDETAWEVGLACGGQIDVFVNVLNEELLAQLRTEIDAERTLVSGTIIRGPENVLGQQMLLCEDESFTGQIGAKLQQSVQEHLVICLRDLISGVRSLSAEVNSSAAAEMFVELILPPKQLIIVGGVHIAQALVKLASVLGYRTIVVDPRKSFGSQERFEFASDVIQAWPQEALKQLDLNPSTAVAMLTHDPKIDDPALMDALPSKAFYVGALGSQKTQSKRRERLIKAGLDAEQLDRLHGPIGLDIGASSPQEIALAIMAEIVSAQP